MRNRWCDCILSTNLTTKIDNLPYLKKENEQLGKGPPYFVYYVAKTLREISMFDIRMQTDKYTIRLQIDYMPGIVDL